MVIAKNYFLFVHRIENRQSGNLVSEKDDSVSVTYNNGLLLCGKIIAAYYENHMKLQCEANCEVSEC
jgi:hypothetical protein